MSNARCEFSELLISECDHCLGGTKTEMEDNKPELRDIVVAEYKGVCQLCGEDILPGDHIGKYGTGWKKDADSDTGWREVGLWAHYGCGR